MNNKSHLRPKDFDSNGDIIPMACKEEKGDLISREALKKDFEERNKACDKWIAKAKDEETKIRASAVKSFICEVIMIIDNAPTVKPCENCDLYFKAMTKKEMRKIGAECTSFAKLDNMPMISKKHKGGAE